MVNLKNNLPQQSDNSGYDVDCQAKLTPFLHESVAKDTRIQMPEHQTYT